MNAEAPVTHKPDARRKDYSYGPNRWPLTENTGLEGYGAVCWFDLDREYFNTTDVKQTLTLEIAPLASWDIDGVGLYLCALNSGIPKQTLWLLNKMTFPWFGGESP